jgi:phosphatidate cytidylyltransferase
LPGSQLLIRLATAAALIAAFLGALFWLDRWALCLVVAVIVALGAFEWARLSNVGAAGSWAYAAVCAGIYYDLAQLAGSAVWLCALAAVFWVTCAPYVLHRGSIPNPLRLWTGLVVILPAGVAMTAIPAREVLMVLVLVWIADTGAYLAGRAFGKRKLAPKISPGKTWEGVMGGAVGTLIYAMIYAMFSPDPGGRVAGVIWVPFLAGALALFALSVLGDLLESALKRQAGAKDSGRLLPGHGGVLDRIDSATAALPAALLLLKALEAA